VSRVRGITRRVVGVRGLTGGLAFAVLAVVVLAVAVLVIAARVSAAEAAGPLPTPQGAADGSPATPLAELDRTAAAAYSGAGLVTRGGGCSGILVAPGDGAAPPTAPAYLLTNGHCIDLLPATAVRRDLDGGGTVDFGWPGSPVARTVPIRGVPWASMKGTDLAIMELDTTLANLVADGISPVRIAALPAEPGTPVVVVGGPAPAGGGPRQLLLATCTLGPRHDLLERDWSWFGFPSNGCAGIRPGSSGSPVIDAATGELVGLVNTGTAGSDGLSDCAMDRPCEVTAAGGRSVRDAVYGPAVDGLGGCFDAGWVFSGPGPGCPLDPGLGLEVSGVALATNPDRPDPRGHPPVTTWGARLTPSDPTLTHYRSKAGPLGAVDCRDPEGYGAPVPLAAAPIWDAPLPRVEGHTQLCLLAGPGPFVDASWQEPRFATVVTAWVDRTPPLLPIDLAVSTEADAWRVEPRDLPPELTAFTWKWGAPDATDCADPAGYALRGRSPAILRRSEAPVRLCVIGYDEANNPTAPLDRIFR
jgi:hypothetical protein